MKVKKSELLSVSELAKLEHKTPQAIRKAIKEQRIYAFKVGGFWVIPKHGMRNLFIGKSRRRRVKR